MQLFTASSETTPDPLPQGETSDFLATEQYDPFYQIILSDAHDSIGSCR